MKTTIRPCAHTSRGAVLETRKRATGQRIRRMQCLQCEARWSVAVDEEAFKVALRGARQSISVAVVRELRASPGSTPDQIGSIIGKSEHLTYKRLLYLKRIGEVVQVGRRWWVAEHAALAVAQPPAPPAPEPTPWSQPLPDVRFSDLGPGRYLPRNNAIARAYGGAS